MLNRERILAPTRVTDLDTVTAAVEVRANAVRARLPYIVRELVGPLYAAFGLFEPPADLFAREIAKMRRPV